LKIRFKGQTSVTRKIASRWKISQGGKTKDGIILLEAFTTFSFLRLQTSLLQVMKRFPRYHVHLPESPTGF